MSRVVDQELVVARARAASVKLSSLSEDVLSRLQPVKAAKNARQTEKAIVREYVYMRSSPFRLSGIDTPRRMRDGHGSGTKS